MDRVSLLQMLEGRVPEFQVQNFAFAGKQVVLNAQALHRAQVAANHGGSGRTGHFRRCAMACFDGVQCFTAQRETRFVFFIEVRHAGIQVPAEIVELRLRGKCAHFFGRFLSDVNKANHDVCDLHAGIVDVVLHLDAPPGAAEQAHQRVAQRCVAQMADVRSLVWIDICVFTMYWRHRDEQPEELPPRRPLRPLKMQHEKNRD